ncbi:hypothetical protein [Sorangium sp. So ce1182]|uniref:hypothetical protein n=1 Tax=Sorangium sp. So ce1182 TaxID=3133334 RepID=UPI003F637E10
MADRVVDKKLRRTYYNRCNPDESLPPDDPRYVDIDAKSPEARGRNWSDALASRIELSEKPVCEFFTGLPGSGKSTELKHLAARLEGKDGARLLPVLIDAETVLDIYNQIDVPEILVAILYKTDEVVLTAEGKDPKDALKDGRFARLWHWLTTTEVELSSLEASVNAKAGEKDVAEVSGGAKAVLDLKTIPTLREKVRAKVAANMTTFIAQVKAALVALNKRAKKLKYNGVVVIFDSLEKLRGISTNWTEVLTSAERIFTGGAPYLQLPVHVIYTLPPALVLRLSEPVHFLPMLKLHDRSGNRAAGFDVARELIRQRVPDEHLREFFGATSGEDRVERLIAWSGGYPREIVRLLQSFIAASSLDEPLFKRLLSQAADQYRRTVPENALRWLARVHLEKRLIIDDDTHRATVDLMVQNNVVLRYLNDAEWFDLHPAVRDMPALRDEIARFQAEQEKLRAEQDKSSRSGG